MRTPAKQEQKNKMPSPLFVTQEVKRKKDRKGKERMISTQKKIQEM